MANIEKDFIDSFGDDMPDSEAVAPNVEISNKDCDAFLTGINELKAKMEEVTKATEELKIKRNEYEDIAAEHAKKWSELNDQFEEITQKAQEYRVKRDEFNTQITVNMIQRNNLNDRVIEVFNRVDDIKRKYRIVDGNSLNKIRKEIDHLEFKQQTEVLTTEKERALIDKISELKEEFKKKEELEQNQKLTGSGVDGISNINTVTKGRSLNELRKEIDHLEFKQQTEVLTTEKERALIDKISELKEEFKKKKEDLKQNQENKIFLNEPQSYLDEASELHKKIKEYFDLAQEYHDKMIECYREMDKIRAEADVEHREYVKALEVSDSYHKLFHSSLKEVSNIDWKIKCYKAEKPIRGDA